MMQRYNFIYIKHVLDKNIFIRSTHAKSNSYSFANKGKTMQTASANKIFRRILAESAKNRTPATLRQRAFFGNKLKIKELRETSV
jgi:hypothetical protein